MLELIGRLHVLLLHLPIGLLCGVVALELWARFRRNERVAEAGGLLITLTAISAVAAAIGGLVLARDQEGDLLFWHRWTGLGLAVLCCLAAWLRWRWQSVGTPGGATYGWVLGLCAAMTMTVGHLGGSITHGEDHLWPRSKREPPLVAVEAGGESGAMEATTGEIDLFARDVVPILDLHCVECHGANKQKGQLRLDSPRAIQAGGESGAVIVPGHPERSLLYGLVSLPHDHDDIMPSKGDPLVPAQIAALHAWIAAGARYSLDTPDSELRTDATSPTDLDRLAATIPPVKEDLLRRVRASGLQVTAISANGALLDVDAGNLGPGFDNSHIKLLRELRHHVAWLDLGGTAIADADLFILRELPNLRRLQLQRSRITDAGLPQVAACAGLDYLNLYATEVSDAGVGELSRLKNLRSLYIWKTRITQNGAGILRKALPGCEINRGE